MKQLLYIAPVIIDFEKLNGVSKKILNQYKVFSKSYNVTLLSYGPDCLYYLNNDFFEAIPLDQANRRLKMYSFINEKLSVNNYNFIYSRYHLCDPLFVNTLRILGRKAIKTVVEIPTYPYKKELLKSHNGFVRYFMDSSSNFLLRFFVGRIVTYSQDDKIYGIKAINTMNGIIYENVIPVQKKQFNNKEIHLISVSMTVICHGYDRLIEGINNYYKLGGDVNIIYHLVGEGEEIKKYKDLVLKYGIEKHVLFYGFKTSDDLDVLYEKADITINSLAIHRIGLQTESTIKSKEYAAKGLPMVSSYTVDAFSSQDNSKYVHQINADETPVDIYELINFYKKMYENAGHNINEEIRLASEKRCDMSVTLNGIIEYFNTAV